MRVYIPATFDMLAELEEDGQVLARQGYGFAVTPAVVEFFTSGDEDDLADFAFDEASRASLRLLVIGSQRLPHRRVVISADLPEEAVSAAPDLGEAVVQLKPNAVPFDAIAAIHVDVESSEEATAKGLELIDAADLGDEDAELAVGDALDNFLAWYDPSELSMLLIEP